LVFLSKGHKNSKWLTEGKHSNFVDSVRQPTKNIRGKFPSSKIACMCLLLAPKCTLCLHFLITGDEVTQGSDTCYCRFSVVASECGARCS
jgi:hypothetical protein